MADYDAIVALRGPRLSDHAVHVKDALVLSLAEEDEYQVGQVQLQTYEFLPFALSGLASAMVTPTTGLRATTEVSIPVTDDAGGAETVRRTVSLYGPGDVLGVDPLQILRRYPAPGSTNAEETFHAHMEFDRPELPWAFSAQTPAPKMRPWLTLIVLEADEATFEPSTPGFLPVLVVDASKLPDLGAAWAMAHAQVAGGPASTSARLSTAHAPANLSRLLAARVLTQNTNYLAVLVPTTTAGVAAGLGLPAPASIAPAWASGAGTVRLPIYDRWEFRTAPDGDFPRLARRLEGVAAPWRIGRRIMDTARPGDPLTDLAPDEEVRRHVIRCALFSPNPAPPDSPDDNGTWNAARTEKLKEAIERAAVVEGRTPQDPGQPPPLPIVGPRVYAQGQRGTRTMPVGAGVPPTGDWFADLNLAPVNRVIAGLGTRVVVKDQEPLMQSAWAQVGEIDAANRALAMAQLSQALATRMHDRLSLIDPGRFLTVVRPVAPRVKMANAQLTLAHDIALSATPMSALGGGMRALIRPRGRVAKLVGGEARRTLPNLVSPGGAHRDFTRDYRLPDGIKGLSDIALASLSPAAVALAYRQPAAEAVQLVTSDATMLRTQMPLATAIMTPTVWRDAPADVNVGSIVAGRMSERIATSARGATDDVVRARWVGGMAAGLATVKDERTRADMAQLAVSLHDRLSSVIQVGPIAPPIRRPGGPVIGGPGGPIVVQPGRPGRGGIGGVVRGGALGPIERISPLRVGAARRSPEAQRVAEPVVRALRDAQWVQPMVRRDGIRGGVLEAAWEPRRPPAGGGLTVKDKVADLLTPAGTSIAAVVTAAAKLDAVTWRSGVADMVAVADVRALPLTQARDVLDVTKADLLTRLDPRTTVVEATRARLSIQLAQASKWLVSEVIRPIMAAPRFDRPMYKALDDYNREWLVPGLGTLPNPEMVTVLEANDAFVEGFLVGLSDEMARELLWREYPTDCRGTYFHRFWDGTKDELSGPIHRFSRKPLGSHVGLGAPGQSGRAVVVVRGEVVRRYPDLTIMAMKSLPRGAGGATTDDKGRPFLPESPSQGTVARTIFVAPLEPDIMLAGLDLTVDELRKPDWWIVLSEHPQAPRFRRSEPDLAGHEVRFAKTTGLAHGAALAADRLENPNRIAWEAAMFLADTTD